MKPHGRTIRLSFASLRPPLALLAVAAAGCGPIEQPRMGTDGIDSVEQMLSVCAGSKTLPGIDVSHWDGAINWSSVAGAGFKWAYAKATESTNYQDNTFAANWSGMKANGVVRGAYHFFHPDIGGKVQADYFLSFVGAIGANDLPPMLDWEVSNGASGATATANAQAFIDEVRLKTGRTTVIYTSPGLWSGFGVTTSFAAEPLWVAHYLYCTSGAGCCPTMPSGWTRWAAWQWSDKGTVPGVPATAVDLDIFDGDLTDLMTFIGGGADAGQPPPIDAGQADAGNSDAGQPPPVDGGSPPVDSGTPDAGQAGDAGGSSGGGAGGGSGGGAGGGSGGSGGGTPVDGGQDAGDPGGVKGGCGCNAVDGFSLWPIGLLALTRRRR